VDRIAFVSRFEDFGGAVEAGQFLTGGGRKDEMADARALSDFFCEMLEEFGDSLPCVHGQKVGVGELVAERFELRAVLKEINFVKDEEGVFGLSPQI
jgi:hypothetical protein